MLCSAAPRGRDLQRVRKTGRNLEQKEQADPALISVISSRKQLSVIYNPASAWHHGLCLCVAGGSHSLSTRGQSGLMGWCETPFELLSQNKCVHLGSFGLI